MYSLFLLWHRTCTSSLLPLLLTSFLKVGLQGHMLPQAQKWSLGHWQHAGLLKYTMREGETGAYTSQVLSTSTAASLYGQGTLGWSGLRWEVVHPHPRHSYGLSHTHTNTHVHTELISSLLSLVPANNKQRDRTCVSSSLLGAPSWLLNKPITREQASSL